MIIIALILIGTLDAFLEVITFKPWESIFNEDKFSPFETWGNKYKKGVFPRVEKFPLSTTLLVWTTDPYHLGRMILRLLTVASLVMYKSDLPFESDLYNAILFYSIERFIFHLFYKYIFIKDLIMKLKSIYLIAFGLLLIGIAEISLQLDKTFVNHMDFEWNSTKWGFWVLIAGFGFVIIYALIKLIPVIINAFKPENQK